MKAAGEPRRYATPGGRRYHRYAHCEGLNSWSLAHGDRLPPAVSLAEVRARGLAPCVICQPPVYGLTVVQ